MAKMIFFFSSEVFFEAAVVVVAFWRSLSLSLSIVLANEKMHFSQRFFYSESRKENHMWRLEDSSLSSAGSERDDKCKVYTFQHESFKSLAWGSPYSSRKSHLLCLSSVLSLHGLQKVQFESNCGLKFSKIGAFSIITVKKNKAAPSIPFSLH